MQEELEQQQRLKQQMQMILMQILQPDARERLNTSRTDQAGLLPAPSNGGLVALAQSGRLKQKITDAQFKELLRRYSTAKRDYSITRK